MGLIDTITRIFKPARREQNALPTQSASAPRRGYTYEDLLSLSTPAMQIATVYRCIKLLSESVAQLPLRYMRLRDGVFVVNDNDPLSYLLNVQPDAAISAFEFKAQMVVNLIKDGNAYIVPVYDPLTPTVSRLVLCSSKSVQHDTDNDLYTVTDTSQGVSGVYRESEIIHLKGMTWDNPKTGVSVLTHARRSIEIAGVGDRETQNRFATGGIVRGIVGNDRGVKGFGEYQDKELNKTAESLDYRFNVNSERIVALPGVVDFKQMSMSSVDMQFLESRKFTVREICRFFGVHPSFVFDDTSNNYKSAEMANVAFLSNTLNPILRKIEDELLRKLVAPSLAFKRKFSFDRRELMACDLDSRVKFQQQSLQAGIYTINDLRRMENLPAVEGGDKTLVSANLRTLEELGQQTGTAIPAPGNDGSDNNKDNDNKNENEKDND